MSIEQQYVEMTANKKQTQQDNADALMLIWMSFAGLLAFVYYLLWTTGIWKLLIEADPTFITIITVCVFTSSTVWVGFRMVKLRHEHQSLLQAKGSLRSDTINTDTAVSDFLKKNQSKPDNALLVQVLADRLHGPNEFMWWVNGIQIKLGLLGKVIGFSILAIQISQIENFDPSQTASLLKALTGGLGVALLTTAVGLVTNMLLGLQLSRIDRFVDRLLADTVDWTQSQ